MSRTKKEDKKYDGFKIDMSWCFGKCRNILSRELDLIISKLFNVKYCCIRTDAKYSKPYIIVTKTNKLNYVISHIDLKDINKNNNKYFVKGYTSFEDIPYVEITANKVFNAVSFDELRYNIPHDAAILKKNKEKENKKSSQEKSTPTIRVNDVWFRNPATLAMVTPPLYSITTELSIK